MSKAIRFRGPVVVLSLLCLATWAHAQRVISYSPAQTTLGYQPATNLSVGITFENFQLAPALPSYSNRAYWDVQGGTLISISGSPGATDATVSIPPSLRTAGDHTVIACLVVNFGQGQQETCTNPATSARFTVNLPPSITTSSPLPNASINTPYSVALAATGGTGARTWSLAQGSSLPPGLSLNPTTGAINGVPSQPGIFNFTIQVADSLGVTGSRLFALAISSTLSIVTGANLPTAGLSVPYSVTIQAAGGNPPYSFSTLPEALPPGLVLNGSSGVLSGTPSVPGNYSFAVVVFDAQENTTSRTFFMEVSGSVSTPTIQTPSPLPDATVGNSYLVTFTAAGGNPPYRYFLLSGQLPPGVALDSNSGVLSGAPSQTGTFNFVIDVQDSQQRVSNKAFTLQVVEGIAITTSQVPAGTVGVPYPNTQVQVSGGVPPFTFTLGSGSRLPAGLFLNPNSGVISGTPSQAGVFPFEVVVFDARERRATRSLSINVGAGLRFRTTSPLPDGRVGEAYNVFLEVEGGAAPYTFEQVSGQVPPGLTFVPSSGRLQGTPTAPFQGTLTVRVLDSSSPRLVAERQFSLRVFAPLTITTTSLPSGIVGQPYSVAIAAAGGAPGYSFVVSAGSLPPGLLLNANGTLSGTPTAIGTSAITIRVNDQAANTAARDFSLEIRPRAVTGATVTLQTSNPSPNTQQEVDVALSESRGEVLEGTLVLEFTPSVNPSVDDPAVQFLSGGRQRTFQIVSGQTSARFGDADRVSFQTGTVAGAITIRAQFRINGIDATPTPPPTSTIVLPPVAPTLTSLTVTRTGTGLNVVVRGYSTPRTMNSATLNFTARAGSNVTSGLSFPVNLSPAFTTWYTSTASSPFGSQFQLTLPVTIAGDSTEITGLSIVLTNSIGPSNSLSTTF